MASAFRVCGHAMETTIVAIILTRIKAIAHSTLADRSSTDAATAGASSNRGNAITKTTAATTRTRRDVLTLRALKASLRAPISAVLQ